MRDDELVVQYPRCYHLAHGPEAWDSIRRHGLLSVSALLDRWEVTDEDRASLLREHRPTDVVLTHPVHGTAVLRDQRPLKVSMLAHAMWVGSGHRVVQGGSRTCPKAGTPAKVIVIS
jgi:hypothetical protein